MKRLFGVVLAAQCAVGGALADPYPFSGFFALKTAGGGAAGCGFDILHQSRDGQFSGYLLDRRHWDAHKQPRFLRYKRGTCSFDGATAIDNCVAHEDHINGVQQKPDRAKITILDNDAVAMLTLGEDDDARALADVPPFVFKRCPFDEAQIRPLLSDDTAGYSSSELKAMARSRDAGVVAEVLDAITRRETAVD